MHVYNLVVEDRSQDGFDAMGNAMAPKFNGGIYRLLWMSNPLLTDDVDSGFDAITFAGDEVLDSLDAEDQPRGMTENFRALVTDIGRALRALNDRVGSPDEIELDAVLDRWDEFEARVSEPVADPSDWMTWSPRNRAEKLSALLEDYEVTDTMVSYTEDGSIDILDRTAIPRYVAFANAIVEGDKNAASLSDSLDDLSTWLADDVTSEFPRTPVVVVDLDTGEKIWPTVHVNVDLKPPKQVPRIERN